MSSSMVWEGTTAPSIYANSVLRLTWDKMSRPFGKFAVHSFDQMASRKAARAYRKLGGRPFQVLLVDLNLGAAVTSVQRQKYMRVAE